MHIEYPTLPVAFMNEDHDHAAEQLETMSNALPGYPVNREPLVQACHEFLEHNRAHFGREEAAMQASGFPPYPVHKGEHDRVLAWMEETVEKIAAGMEADAVKRIVEQEIPDWFVQHIQTMDRVTAIWIANHEPVSRVAV